MLALYGFGKLGEKIHKNLKIQNISVDMILDKFKRESTFYDKKIITPEEVDAVQRKKISVIITTYKQELAIGELDGIKKYLSDLGFYRIFNIQEAILEYNIDFEYFYISNPNNYLKQLNNEVKDAKKLFKDEISITTFEDRLNFLKTGNVNNLNQNIVKETQYVPVFFLNYLRKRNQKLRVLDCGACYGDLLISLMSKNLNILEYIAFEPDIENCLVLKKNISKFEINGSISNIGISDSYAQLKFNSNGDMSSAVSESGNEIIRVNSIDNTIFGNIDFIKMDIEGFEMPALKGALNTIKKYKPALAISIYHKPLDFIEIPLFLSNYYDNIYIRQHANYGFDLVLYAY